MKMKCRECRSDLHAKLNHENIYLVEPCEECFEKLNIEMDEKETSLQERDEESYDEGYSKGFSEGYDEGYDLGYEEGHSSGYDKGHEEGYDEGFLADHEE